MNKSNYKLKAECLKAWLKERVLPEKKPERVPLEVWNPSIKKFYPQ